MFQCGCQIWGTESERNWHFPTLSRYQPYVLCVRRRYFFLLSCRKVCFSLWLTVSLLLRAAGDQSVVIRFNVSVATSNTTSVSASCQGIYKVMQGKVFEIEHDFASQFILFGISIGLAIMISLWICVDSRKRTKHAASIQDGTPSSSAGYQSIGDT